MTETNQKIQIHKKIYIFYSVLISLFYLISNCILIHINSSSPLYIYISVSLSSLVFGFLFKFTLSKYEPSQEFIVNKSMTTTAFVTSIIIFPLIVFNYISNNIKSLNSGESLFMYIDVNYYILLLLLIIPFNFSQFLFLIEKRKFIQILIYFIPIFITYIFISFLG